MILKHIFFKNFILKTITYNYTPLNILLLLKQLTLLYIIAYTYSVLNKQILFINHFSVLNNDFKLLKFFTNSPYINNKKLDNFINNWKILKNQLLLLKWLIYLINLINKNKIKLPFNNIIKLFKKFIILKHNYWTINNLKYPKYFFILLPSLDNKLLKNYLKFNKQLFFITLQHTSLEHLTHSIIASPNFICLKLILELFNTAHLQGKYYI